LLTAKCATECVLLVNGDLTLIVRFVRHQSSSASRIGSARSRMVVFPVARTKALTMSVNTGG
jgi:hypothetical protein